MKIKALTSFAGAATMAPGEIKDVPDAVAADVIRCGFAEAVGEPKTEAPAEEIPQEPPVEEKPAKKTRAKKTE